MEMQRGFKLLNIFTGFFVAVLVVVPSLGAKFVAVGPFNFPGGTLIFPLVFIINGVLTEVYGFARSRRVIWIGLVCQALAALAWWLVGIWPAAPFWHNQEAYASVLGVAPRITLASFLAYFCGEFIKSTLLSIMKFRQGGRRGWVQSWRFIASSIVGEFVDSAVFMSVAFAGTIPASDFLETTITLWIAKVIYEAVALPVTVRFSNWVKKFEDVDKMDRPEETNYNPFGGFSKGD
jgi:queuosine precursor transporter